RRARESAARTASGKLSAESAEDAEIAESCLFLASPVLLFDLLDFFLAQPEVVSDLVDQRLADRDDQIVFVVGLALERTLEEEDAVRQRVSIVPSSLRQRHALIETEQRVGRLDLH